MKKKPVHSLIDCSLSLNLFSRSAVSPFCLLLWAFIRLCTVLRRPTAPLANLLRNKVINNINKGASVKNKMKITISIELTCFRLLALLPSAVLWRCRAPACSGPLRLSSPINIQMRLIFIRKKDLKEKNGNPEQVERNQHTIANNYRSRINGADFK